ncbi:MAG: S26 family signal peptidase [Bryobacteraceae bacterium]
MAARLKRRLRWFLLVLAALGLLPAYLRAYKISGASEIPTVLLGDQIIVNHAAYAFNAPYTSTRLFRTGSAKRGDFVFLQLPNNSRLKGKFSKRIIGLPERP